MYAPLIIPLDRYWLLPAAAVAAAKAPMHLAGELHPIMEMRAPDLLQARAALAALAAEFQQLGVLGLKVVAAAALLGMELLMLLAVSAGLPLLMAGLAAMPQARRTEALAEAAAHKIMGAAAAADIQEAEAAD